MIEEIQADLFRIEVPLPGSPLKYLNVYAIRGAEMNLVIDTGLNRSECFQALEGGLRELGINVAKTDFFITHLHADHFGLVAKVASEANKLYFNGPDKAIMEAGGQWSSMMRYASMNGFPEEEFREVLERHPGFRYGSDKVPQMDVLRDGDLLEVGRYSFECIETPGHTRGHTCLYEREKKIFISGDHILYDITPNIQCWSDNYNPLEQYLASLDKVYPLDVELVLPGHRRLFKHYKERILELKIHHRNRAEEVLLLLNNDSMHAYEIASRMSWDIAYESWESFPPPQKWFATGEAIAHLRYLEDKGAIFRRAESPLIIYARADRPSAS